MIIALAMLSVAGPGLIPLAGGVAVADIQGKLCKGVGAAANDGQTGCGGGGVDAEGTISNVATKVVNVFSVLVGAVAVIMIIYGGFRYITSGGDSGSVGNAKNTLIYAIVGLIVVALAQLIVRIVINQSQAAVQAPTE